MRSVHSIFVVIGFVLFFGGDNGSSALAKTVEAGDTSTSWNGSGEVVDLVDGHQVINAKVQGMIIARHKTTDSKMVVHTSKLVCPVRVDQKRSDDYMMIEGLCTMMAHEGRDIGFAHWKCVGSLNECKGEFTFTGGLGGFTGMSGKTPFETRLIWEAVEGGKANAVGYAIWPNMTYVLP